ncbi:MAG: hypothetical protein QOH42_410 [Blastocatellia bacterium]|nr:hypothetical protein [Blastocatellia bacterium]
MRWANDGARTSCPPERTTRTGPCPKSNERAADAGGQDVRAATLTSSLRSCPGLYAGARSSPQIPEGRERELNWVAANNEAERMAKMDCVGRAGAGNTRDRSVCRAHRSQGHVLAHSSRGSHSSLDEYSLRRTFLSRTAACALSGFGNSPATTRPAAAQTDRARTKSIGR